LAILSVRWLASTQPVRKNSLAATVQRRLLAESDLPPYATTTAHYAKRQTGSGATPPPPL